MEITLQHTDAMYRNYIIGLIVILVNIIYFDT